ncbi:hypothetical protein VO70_12290 [Aeromonas salmonicida]|nr:hypothetical protein VO70_12290 [Aeromonas salmonicida]
MFQIRGSASSKPANSLDSVRKNSRRWISCSSRLSQTSTPDMDIMMFQIRGISFEQACEQLGLSPQEQQALDQLQQQAQSN